MLGRVGKGAFGAVFKVKRVSDGKSLVWKEIDYGQMSEKEKQQLVAEVNILRELKHPHIVRYHDRVLDKPNTRIYIVMEYCEGGDLLRLISKCRAANDYIAEDVIWKVLTQVLLALHACHKGKILHRDIKPGNVFLDKQMNVKIGDFGLSRALGEHSVFATTHVGTPYYMSPEQITDCKYNEKSDVWSTGCLLYEIASLWPPFRAKSHAELASKISRGKFQAVPERYSLELRRVIELMLTVDYQLRPDVGGLLRVPLVDLRVREKGARDQLEVLRGLEASIAHRLEQALHRQKALLRRERALEKENVAPSGKDYSFDQIRAHYKSRSVLR